jgi:hypothetical protein
LLASLLLEINTRGWNIIMIHDRSKDFVTLFIEGDLRVIPVGLLDQLLDEMIAEGNQSSDFLQSRLFFMDPKVMENENSLEY